MKCAVCGKECTGHNREPFVGLLWYIPEHAWKSGATRPPSPDFCGPTHLRQWVDENTEELVRLIGKLAAHPAAK